MLLLVRSRHAPVSRSAERQPKLLYDFRPVADINGNRRRILTDGEILPPYALHWRNLRQPVVPRIRPRLLGPSTAEAPRTDILQALDVDPLKETMNAQLLEPFITPVGGVQPRKTTGLSRKSQAKVGKAIRRAQAMGLMPHFDRRAVIRRDSDSRK